MRTTSFATVWRVIIIVLFSSCCWADIFCTKCGARNPDDANFCGKCGKQLAPLGPTAPERGEEAGAYLNRTLNTDRTGDLVRSVIQGGVYLQGATTISKGRPQTYDHVSLRPLEGPRHASRRTPGDVEEWYVGGDVTRDKAPRYLRVSEGRLLEIPKPSDLKEVPSNAVIGRVREGVRTKILRFLKLPGRDFRALPERFFTDLPRRPDTQTYIGDENLDVWYHYAPDAQRPDEKPLGNREQVGDRRAGDVGAGKAGVVVRYSFLEMKKVVRQKVIIGEQWVSIADYVQGQSGSASGAEEREMPPGEYRLAVQDGNKIRELGKVSVRDGAMTEVLYRIHPGRMAGILSWKIVSEVQVEGQSRDRWSDFDTGR